MIAPLMKYVKLYYQNGHTPDQVIGQNEYYPVFICPKEEMKHADVTEVAQELVARSNSPEWRWQLRRPVTVGDMFTVDTMVYSFVAPDTVNDTRILKLNIWKHLAIARVGQEQCMESTSTTPSSLQQSQL